MRFKLWTYEWPVTILTYTNDRTAFSWHTDNWEPIRTITVNIPDCDIEEDEVIIDTNNMSYIWEVITQLKEQWFIWDFVKDASSWFVSYPVYKVSQEVLDIINQ